VLARAAGEDSDTSPLSHPPRGPRRRRGRHRGDGDGGRRRVVHADDRVELLREQPRADAARPRALLAPVLGSRSSSRRSPASPILRSSGGRPAPFLCTLSARGNRSEQGRGEPPARRAGAPVAGAVQGCARVMMADGWRSRGRPDPELEARVPPWCPRRLLLPRIEAGGRGASGSGGGRLRVHSHDAPRRLRRRWEQGRATTTSSWRQLHGDGEARRDLPPPSPSATTSRPAPRSPPLPLRRPPPPLPSLSLLPRRLPSPDGAVAHLRRSGATWHLRRQEEPQRRGEDGTTAVAQELRLPSSCSMQCQKG
jgi:hypothetical protein